MKIFVTRKIPEKGLDILRKKHEVEVFLDDRIPTKKEIINGVKNKDGLLCLLTDNIDIEVINSSSKLKMISNYAVGYNNIDIKEATEKKIPVSNTPGVLTDATAEMAWALLLSSARRIVEADDYTRKGKFNGWSPTLMLGQMVSGKTLGIIGAGRIGTAVALKSLGFNMKVLYMDRNKNEKLEKKLNAKKVGLEELMKRSDYITIHLPLTKKTKHLIGKKELKLMKKSAVLVNTSRGGVIDEKVLIKALEEKWFFSAGLDVYEDEPKIPERLKKLDNVILQPHAGSATYETRSKMAEMAAKNMNIGLEGRRPPNCVNGEIFKE
ncbi:MAG: D-glycerate dehydrogenase [Candidatus Thermoplasmatota archaeon]